MRVAWFSPLPPVRSGVAAYSADLLPLLASTFTIDAYTDATAHDFVWTHQLAPYDLTVYQLGNAPCHDYMWGYLARYPGLVVLHDARLHHARARDLLSQARADDYRAEFRYDHPDAPASVAEYAVEGLSGSIYYLWSMLRVPMATARLVAVHNARVTADLSTEYPHVAIETIRMGVPRLTAGADARARVRRSLDLPDEAFVFAAFGKVTPEKRISAILESLAALRRDGVNAWLMVVGEADDRFTHAADGVRTTGYVPDEAIGAHLSAADACLCLRWPTALETSASWLRCLAAARPTVLSDLAHLADVPRNVALRVDVWNETPQLTDAMRRLASDARLREDVAREGHAYWAAAHTLDAMAADYRRILPAAAARPVPVVSDLPRHIVRDYADAARTTARAFGLDLDLLRPR